MLYPSGYQLEIRASRMVFPTLYCVWKPFGETCLKWRFISFCTWLSWAFVKDQELSVKKNPRYFSSTWAVGHSMKYTDSGDLVKQPRIKDLSSTRGRIREHYWYLPGAKQPPDIIQTASLYVSNKPEYFGYHCFIVNNLKPTCLKLQSSFNGRGVCTKYSISLVSPYTLSIVLCPPRCWSV